MTKELLQRFVVDFFMIRCFQRSVLRLDADELTGFVVGQSGIHKSRDLIPLPEQNEKVLLVRSKSFECEGLKLTIV